MKVYLKIHRRNDIETVACCDETLLNHIFTEGDLRIEIDSNFFEGDLLSIEQALEILKKINNIPMAIKMMF